MYIGKTVRIAASDLKEENKKKGKPSSNSITEVVVEFVAFSRGP